MCGESRVWLYTRTSTRRRLKTHTRQSDVLARSSSSIKHQASSPTLISSRQLDAILPSSSKTKTPIPQVLIPTDKRARCSLTWLDHIAQ
ncbi:hypothetical protein CBOM_02024 [Ceraceosorus bombacis]|uniref:Uncharacterized protein n=1 Tax=Ceraceosorus bombacis TaxID=401625 RepID=A0A0P1BFA1_9BASI|nr:hypothetical protein CBOM_02024 [Ceraceosorus bombacis]